MNEVRRTILNLTAIAALVAGLPGSADAQTRAESHVTDPNGHPFRMPTVSPLESVYRLAPVHVTRGDRRLWVGLGELGDRWSFWLRQRPEEKFELSGTVHLKAASRFDLEQITNPFIEITYRIGGYLRARVGQVAARLELYHLSAHLGDEYLLQENVEPVETSREGLDLLLQVSPMEGLVVFGGPGYLVRSAPGFREGSFRLGAEWEAATDHWARPFIGVDTFAWAEQDWDPQVAAEAGAALGNNARITFLLGFGPSRAGQFLRDTETLVGLSFTYRRQ